MANAASIPWTNDFSDNADEFNGVVGTWSIVGEEYKTDPGAATNAISVIDEFTMTSGWEFEVDAEAVNYWGSGWTLPAQVSLILTDDDTDPRGGNDIMVIANQFDNDAVPEVTNPLVQMLFYNEDTLIRAGSSNASISADGTYHLKVTRAAGSQTLNTTLTYNDGTNDVTINDACTFGGSYNNLDDLDYVGLRSGSDIMYFDNLSIIPEPATMTALICSSWMLLLHRKRKR